MPVPRPFNQLRLAPLALAISCLASASALALALALPAECAEPPAQGVTVVRDAQSGQLRAPTAEEFKILQEQAARLNAQAGAREPDTAAIVVVHPNGARSVRLGERGMVYAVATRDANGQVHTDCVQGKPGASQEESATKENDHAHP